MKQLFTQITPSKFWFNLLILPILSLFFATTLLVTPAEATGVYSLPQINSGDSVWVVDSAETISRASEGKLSRILEKLAKDTGEEVRIVAIRGLNYDETIENFTNKLFERWFPTAEEQANQTLVAIDVVTNNSSIRTGEEVKQLLSDEIISSITTDTIELRLREGNKYNQALIDASDRLAAVLSGEPDPGAIIAQNEINTEGTFTKAEDTDRGVSTVWIIGLLVVATIIPMATYFFYVGFSN